MSVQQGESMREVWASWQGHVLNGTFPLHRWLGSSDHSGVFLTELTLRKSAQVAIKVVPAIAAFADAQLAQWSAAALLDHPHLIRILETGQCQFDGAPYLYVVTEYADQTLAELLPRRPLTEVEAREMLIPALDALAFLHNRNLVQGQLKPANILAVGDQLKLASDTVRSVSGGSGNSLGSMYDPPEARDGSCSTASDVWALGVTLFETLAQRAPSLDERRAGVAFPPDFPPAFRSLVTWCLSRRPYDRPKVAEIEAWVRREGDGSPTAAAVASVPDLEVPELQGAAVVAPAVAEAIEVADVPEAKAAGKDGGTSSAGDASTVDDAPVAESERAQFEPALPEAPAIVETEFFELDEAVVPAPDAFEPIEPRGAGKPITSAHPARVSHPTPVSSNGAAPRVQSAPAHLEPQRAGPRVTQTPTQAVSQASAPRARSGAEHAESQAVSQASAPRARSAAEHTESQASRARAAGPRGAGNPVGSHASASRVPQMAQAAGSQAHSQRAAQAAASTAPASRAPVRPAQSSVEATGSHAVLQRPHPTAGGNAVAHATPQQATARIPAQVVRLTPSTGAAAPQPAVTSESVQKAQLARSGVEFVSQRLVYTVAGQQVSVPHPRNGSLFPLALAAVVLLALSWMGVRAVILHRDPPVIARVLPLDSQDSPDSTPGGNSQEPEPAHEQAVSESAVGASPTASPNASRTAASPTALTAEAPSARARTAFASAERVSASSLAGSSAPTSVAIPVYRPGDPASAGSDSRSGALGATAPGARSTTLLTRAAPSSGSAGSALVAVSTSGAPAVGASAQATLTGSQAVEGTSSALHEEIPDVPQRARRSIRGHVRVSVRVIVDNDGSVFAALVDEPGPSPYFARIALDAAKQWTFPPSAASRGRTADRRWAMVRFDFTRDGTTGQAAPVQ